MSLKRRIMALSAAGLLAIAGYEGYSEFAYEPLPGDRLTIGFGHTGDVRPGDKVDLKEALSLLDKDTRYAQNAVNRNVTILLSQNEFDALVSLVYNIGETQFRNSTLLRCLNKADFDCVHREWMRWKYFKGKPVKGLENRRARELAVFCGETVERTADDRLCFGSAGCISYGELLQERGSSPDGAAAG